MRTVPGYSAPPAGRHRGPDAVGPPPHCVAFRCSRRRRYRDRLRCSGRSGRSLIGVAAGGPIAIGVVALVLLEGHDAPHRRRCTCGPAGSWAPTWR